MTSSVLQRGAEQRRGTGPGAMRSNSASSFLSPTLLRPCQCSCPGKCNSNSSPPSEISRDGHWTTIQNFATAPECHLLRGIHARRLREIGAPRESLCNRYHLEMLGEMRELRRGSSEGITIVGELRGRPRQRSACKAAMRPRNRAKPAMQSPLSCNAEPLASIPKSVKKLS